MDQPQDSFVKETYDKNEKTVILNKIKPNYTIINLFTKENEIIKKKK